MDYAQVRAYWKDRLAAVPEVALTRASLSPATQRFLREVGLPKQAPLLLHFYAGDRLFSPLAHQGSDYRILGDDEGTTICIRLPQGDVWSVDPANQLPLRYMNSSIEKLVVFLQFYLEYADTLTTVSAMRSQFSLEDPPALHHPENWWSVIVEQLENELL